VVDDVGEVDVRFSAFVFVGVKGRVRVVDDVDCVLPSSRVVR
jgi:hypothetical protein